MGRHKLERFAINALRENVIEEGKEIFNKIKGNWNTYFKNNQTICLEVGCGKGDYTTELAELFPEQNFIGTDIKGSRIWKGSTVATEKKLNNVAFLRTQIDRLTDFFEPSEINEIWITFPDPRPRDKDEKHRLTCERFIDIYRKILSPNGTIHLKTDSDFLFEYTLNLIQNSKSVSAKNIVYTDNLYQSDLLLHHHHGLTTAYERRFLAEGKTIKYIKFNL